MSAFRKHKKEQKKKESKPEIQEEVEMAEKPKPEAVDKSEIDPYLNKAGDDEVRQNYAINASEHHGSVPDRAYLSDSMLELKELLKQYEELTISRHVNEKDRQRLLDESEAKFERFCSTLKDYGEILMALYICV